MNNQVNNNLFYFECLFIYVFIIILLQDFSTSSLQGEVAIENAEDVVAEDGLSIYQICKRKRWEQRYIYIWFWTCIFFL